MSYLLQLWELDGVCHPDCSKRFIDHLGVLGLSHDEVVAIILRCLSCLVSQTFPSTGLAVNTFRNSISS
jgi:hypothetical protein